MLRVGLVLLAAIRLEVLARRGAREAVASGTRRSAAHVNVGDGVDVLPAIEAILATGTQGGRRLVGDHGKPER